MLIVQPYLCVLVTFINVGICVFLFKVLVLCLYFVCAQVSLACSQNLLLCWASWFRGTPAPPCLWLVNPVLHHNNKRPLLQPRLLLSTPARQHRRARWWLLLVLNLLPLTQGWTLRVAVHHSSNGRSSRDRNEGYLPHQRYKLGVDRLKVAVTS